MRKWLATVCSIVIVAIVLLIVVLGSIDFAQYFTDLAVGLTLLIVSVWVWALQPEIKRITKKEKGGIPSAIKSERQEVNYSNTEKAQSYDYQSVLFKDKVLKNSIYLENENEPTELSLNNDTLDEIYNKTKKIALAVYSDSKLSVVHIQVLPYEKVLGTDDTAIKSAVTIFFDFYSKNAQKVCEVSYDELYGPVHKFPDRDAINDFERAFFDKIPWKGVHWSEFLNKAYGKVKPLSISDDTHYQLSCMANSRNLPWGVTFFDGFNGRKRIFYWNGKGKNEKDIEIKSFSIGEKPAD